MLHIHHSNRLERLADRLCEVIAAPLGAPLAPETILVPNPGMARWLSLAVAQRLGVAANLDCVFPAAFVWRVLRAQDADLPPTPPAEQGPLLFGLLAAFAGPDRPAEVERYLAGDDGLKAWQLARRLADCYQRYQVFRPDWLAAWEAGADTGWDARLWRQVAAGRPHQGRLLIDLAQRVRGGRLAVDGLPARLSVFGLSALAPAYLQLLQALAGHMRRACAFSGSLRRLLARPAGAARGGAATPHVGAAGGRVRRNGWMKRPTVTRCWPPGARPGASLPASCSTVRRWKPRTTRTPAPAACCGACSATSCFWSRPVRSPGRG